MRFEWKTYTLYSLIALIRRLPPGVGLSIWRTIGRVRMLRDLPLRQQLGAYQTRCGVTVPVGTVMARSVEGWALAQWVRTYGDTPHLSALQSRICVSGLPELDKALSAGKGVILATFHTPLTSLTSWFLQQSGYRAVTIVNMNAPVPPGKRRHIAFLQRLLGPAAVLNATTQLRTAHRLLETDGVALLPQDMGLGGEPVSFLGHTRNLPLGAIPLARRTGAQIIPCTWHCLNGVPEIVFKPPLTLTGTSSDRRALADALEDLVGAYPHAFDLWSSMMQGIAD